MKINKARLRQIISEEVASILGEKKDKVSKKISYLMDKEDKPQDQAVAIALSMKDRGELEEGFKSGEKVTHEEYGDGIVTHPGTKNTNVAVKFDKDTGRGKSIKVSRGALKKAVKEEMDAMRGADRQRAEKLVDILYPDVTNQELVFTLRQEDDEGSLADSLFGFMFPAETKMNKPNPVLMDRVEEWVGMFRNPKNAALEFKGRSNTENLESLLTYIDKKSMDIGKDMFDKVKADADAAGPARDVPVGRSATPGTQEYDALQALMSIDTPPKRRR